MIRSSVYVYIYIYIHIYIHVCIHTHMSTTMPLGTPRRVWFTWIVFWCLLCCLVSCSSKEPHNQTSCKTRVVFVRFFTSQNWFWNNSSPQKVSYNSIKTSHQNTPTNKTCIKLRRRGARPLKMTTATHLHPLFQGPNAPTRSKLGATREPQCTPNHENAKKTSTQHKHTKTQHC